LKRATVPTDAAPDAPLSTAENVTKVYRAGQVDVPALRGVSLDVAAGELVADHGPSARASRRS
jgi:putative ABC transport system ATP-binding protein